jgi:hypothetical protein
MKKLICKEILLFFSLLLFLPLFSGCFLAPSVNQAPTITSTQITTATVDELYTYNVNATDPDSGDSLTYSLTTNPSGMTINSTTGVINWTPSVEGDYDVIVKVSDGELYDTQSFSIMVSEAPIVIPPAHINHAPTIISTPDTMATVGVLYVYDVNATDSDGDIPSYSLTTNPTDMTIDSVTGVISWTATIAQIGDHDVVVEVSDGEKSTTQSFTITVHDVLTEIIVLPETMTLFEGGKTETIASVTARYNNGDTEPIALAACTYGSNNLAAATVAAGVVTSVDPGIATITVTYTEGTVTKTDTVEVTVNEIVLTEIIVLPETMTLFEGGKTETIASVLARYNNGDTAPIALGACTYGSDDLGVATVAVGEVTTVDDGTATITVTYVEGGVTKTDTVEVTVNEIVLDHIVVLPETMDLFITVVGSGETETIASVTAHYNNGDTAPIALGACTYHCEDVTVATVAAGVVTAVGAGTTTIHVNYNEGTTSKSDTIEVNVSSANLELITLTGIVDLPNPVIINIKVEDVADLMGANITLNFDATKLQHVSSTAGSFFSSAFVLPTVDNVNGSVGLALTALGVFPSGTGNIITVNFSTIATGVTDITFGTTQLRNNINADIVHTSGSGYSVTIN